MNEVPDDIVVVRSFCLDTARHLALAGRYPRFLALPDRWGTWRYSAVRRGMQLIRKYRPDIIWSTYPLATAHLIAANLHRKTGIPWVSDFRDSMTEAGYPSDPIKRKVFLNIEQVACEHSSAVVFTAPGTLSMYRERYPQLARSEWVEIPNGFDDVNFPGYAKSGLSPQLLTLVHSGIIYPSERDPSCFFDAIAELKQEGKIDAGTVRIVLRATGHDNVIAPMLLSRNIGDIVKLAPGIDYAQAIEEMMSASGLLLFQASNCNHQIPAKLYEYMHAGKPVFGMTDPGGDTAARMREVGLTDIAPIDDKRELKIGLTEMLSQIRTGSGVAANPAMVRNYSRKVQTRRLADLLSSVANRRHF